MTSTKLYILCAFITWALKANSNGRFKGGDKILFFNHKKYISATTMPRLTSGVQGGSFL